MTQLTKCINPCWLWDSLQCITWCLFAMPKHFFLFSPEFISITYWHCTWKFILTLVMRNSCQCSDVLNLSWFSKARVFLHFACQRSLGTGLLLEPGLFWLSHNWVLEFCHNMWQLCQKFQVASDKLHHSLILRQKYYVHTHSLCDARTQVETSLKELNNESFLSESKEFLYRGTWQTFQAVCVTPTHINLQPALETAPESKGLEPSLWQSMHTRGHNGNRLKATKTGLPCQTGNTNLTW